MREGAASGGFPAGIPPNHDEEVGPNPRSGRASWHAAERLEAARPADADRRKRNAHSGASRVSLRPVADKKAGATIPMRARRHCSAVCSTPRP